MEKIGKNFGRSAAVVAFSCGAMPPHPSRCGFFGGSEAAGKFFEKNSVDNLGAVVLQDSPPKFIFISFEA